MNKEIKNILQCWHSSLSRFGKIDSWNIVENLSSIGNYLRKKEDSSSLRSSIKSIRDSVISGSYSPQSLLHSIERILTLENKKTEAEAVAALGTGEHVGLATSDVLTIITGLSVEPDGSFIERLLRGPAWLI